MSEENKVSENVIAITTGTFAAWLVIGGISLAAWGCPAYNVWHEGMKGEGELRRAEGNRKIVIQEAEAKREAAKSLAQAEIERAKGVAEANKIIGESLKGNDDYLRYLWVQGLENGTAPTIVYVPTEAGLPILEASRLIGSNKQDSKKK